MTCMLDAVPRCCSHGSHLIDRSQCSHHERCTGCCSGGRCCPRFFVDPKVSLLKSKCLLPLAEIQWSSLASCALRRGHLQAQTESYEIRYSQLSQCICFCRILHISG